MNADQRNALAVRMRTLLDDDDIKDGLAQIEADLMQAWKTCFDERERNNFWLSIQLLDRLQTWMRSAASYDLTAIRRAK